MSNNALPHEAELRNWAARELGAQGEVALSRMPRLASAVSRAGGAARAQIQCRRDEQHRFLVQIDVDMSVVMQCQRCLNDVDIALAASSLLCLIWSDEVVGDLPSDYEPLVTGDVTQLFGVVEDELLLVLPAAPMHNTASCMPVEREFGVGPAEAVVEKEKPFAALEGLLKKRVDE